VGAAVVLCDAAGAGPMVTTAALDRLRALNFGIRTLREPLVPEVLAREIARYDPADAAQVSRRIRAEAGREAAVDEIVGLYGEVLAEHARHSEDGEDTRAASVYLQWLGPFLKKRVTQAEGTAHHLSASATSCASRVSGCAPSETKDCGSATKGCASATGSKSSAPSCRPSMSRSASTATACATSEIGRSPSSRSCAARPPSACVIACWRRRSLAGWRG